MVKWMRWIFVLVTGCVLAAVCPAALQGQRPSASLGLFDSQSDVGAVTPAGAAHFDSTRGSYTITSAGTNLWATADEFHFVWKKMSGDVSLTADIDFPDRGGEHNPHRKALLMFRQGLEPDGVYADAAEHGSGLTALQYRRTTGANTQDIELTTGAPQRLRLEKRGDTITMFESVAGEPLHQVGASIKLHFAEPFYAGIGVCSHDAHAVEKAVFSNVKLETPAPQQNTALTIYSTLQTIAIDEVARVATVVATKQGRMEAPNWSRDGSTLIFNESGRLFRVSIKGGTPEAIPTGDATRCGGSHGLSPDGKLLAISCSTPDKVETRVYVLPLDGGAPRLLTEHPYSYFHSWSPDGKTIAFTRPSHGSGNILAIAARGGEEKPLTTGDGISDDPDYSPDGRYIYFNSDRAGGMQIWRMNADGSAPEQMTHDDLVNWTPHISPDGKWMVFLSYEKGTTGHPSDRDVELRLMSLGDGKVHVLVDFVGGSGSINVPSWAPDSRHLAFVSYQPLPPQ